MKKNNINVDKVAGDDDAVNEKLNKKSTSNNSISISTIKYLATFFGVVIFAVVIYYVNFNSSSSAPTIGEMAVSTLESYKRGYYDSGKFEFSSELLINNMVQNNASIGMTEILKNSVFRAKGEIAWQGLRSSDLEITADFDAKLKEQKAEKLGIFESQKFALSFKSFNDKFYMKIGELPSMLYLATPKIGEMSDQILNHWFSFAKEIADSYSEKYINEFTNTFGADTENLNEQLIFLLDESGAFEVLDGGNDFVDKLKGVTVMNVKIDFEKLGDAVIELQEKFGVSDMPESDQLNLMYDIEAIKESPIKEGNIAILIDKNNNFIGIRAEGRINTDEDKNDISLSFQGNVVNLNKKFRIEKPSESRDFTELFIILYGMINPSVVGRQDLP